VDGGGGESAPRGSGGPALVRLGGTGGGTEPTPGWAGVSGGVGLFYHVSSPRTAAPHSWAGNMIKRAYLGWKCSSSPLLAEAAREKLLTFHRVSEMVVYIHFRVSEMSIDPFCAYVADQ
jgi:hypothetical protein